MDFTTAMAQVLMTLSALAYTEDTASNKCDPPPALSIVKESLQHELAKKHYATRNQWTLAWGPIQYNPTRNLVYVAQKKGTDKYAVVLRGTVGSFSSFSEDVPTGQVSFGYGLPKEAKVSKEFDKAFKGILGTPDPKTNTLLGDYLRSTAITSGPLDLYVTGHSQGAGLASMMTAWAHMDLENWGNKPHKITNYTFAAPSAGNPAFAKWIDDNTTSLMVRNPLDIVPHGYASVNKVIKDALPTRVPFGWSIVVDLANGLTQITGPWAQPKYHWTLDREYLDQRYSYFEQVGGQHNHNSYLYLLGATQTDVGDQSPLDLPYSKPTKARKCKKF